MRSVLRIALLSILIVAPVQAQEALRSPSQFLGYELGDRFTRHHQVVEYFHHVSAASANVESLQYGETNEGRPLMVAFVSTPENLARLEEIRTDNLKLAGLLEGDPVGDPLSIVWLSYNVHGDESSSTEAAMATLYDLADPTNEQTQSWLQNTLVVMDPAVNPDGRDRYVNWYNETVGDFPNPDPDAQEHAQRSPGGRTNHYNFDLNRDWAWLTQKETRARIALYEKWMPHIHVDYHEQGVNSPYYFAPGAEPYHAAITDWQREFQDIIGRNHAKYFDRNGWLYFTKQEFDLFYPGYGDTFPIYNGAIGMTYEQAGGGGAGLGILTAESDTLTLADRIAHHHTTGLSTVEVGSAQHDRMLAEFKNYFEKARTNPEGQYRTYVVKARPGDTRLATIARHLEALGIRIGTASDTKRARGFSYRTGETTSFEVAPGDLVLSAFQPRSTLLRLLFEPEAAIPDSITYDITAWAMPYAYDVEAYATPERLESSGSLPAAGAGGVTGSVREPYAWLTRWSDVSDVHFLAALMRENVKVRYAEKSFAIGGETYRPGTLIITRTGNESFGSRLGSVVERIARREGQPVVPISTGFVDDGPDLGSGDVHYIERPEIAVLRGNGVSSSSSGEIWHYFDRQVEYPVTLVSPSALSRIDLNDYDVLVLPDGSYNSILGEEQRRRLLAWVRSGGRLVAVDGAATFFAGKEGSELKRKESDEEDDDNTPSDTLSVYGERGRDSATGRNAGAIYRVTVDATHPLAFGFGDTSFILKLGTQAPAYLAGRGLWNVGILEKGSLVSGYVGYEAQKTIEESLAFGVQDSGRGAIVYLVDDPLFRGFWYSGRLLFGNAVFLVGQ